MQTLFYFLVVYKRLQHQGHYIYKDYFFLSNIVSYFKGSHQMYLSTVFAITLSKCNPSFCMQIVNLLISSLPVDFIILL